MQTYQYQIAESCKLIQNFGIFLYILIIFYEFIASYICFKFTVISTAMPIYIISLGHLLDKDHNLLYSPISCKYFTIYHT